MEPFGWPRGSVRALLCLGLVLGLIPCAIWAPSEGFAGYTALAGVCLRDYFAHRSEENRVSGPVLPEPVAHDEE